MESLHILYVCWGFWLGKKSFLPRTFAWRLLQCRDLLFDFICHHDDDSLWVPTVNKLYIDAVV